MLDGVRLLVFLLFQLPLALAAWRLLRPLGLRRWDERLAGGAVVYAALATVSFWLLAPLGLLGRPGALIVAAGILAAAWLATRRCEPPPPPLGPAEGWTPRRIVELCAAAIALGLTAARIHHALELPPLGHDSLTYHLFFPVKWLQAGALERVSVPLVRNASIEYFPINGEILFCWWILPTGDTALANVLQGVALGFVYPATVMTARALGARDDVAAAGALAVLFVPALAGNSLIGNTELLLGLFWLAGIAFWAKAETTGDRRLLLLAGAALGLAIGTKLIGVVLAGPLLIAIAAREVARTIGDPDRPPALPRAAMLLGPLLATGAPSYLWNMIATGNPLYPLTLRVGGLTVLDGAVPPGFHEKHDGFTAATWEFFVNEGQGQMALHPQSAIVLLLPLAALAIGLALPAARRRVPALPAALVLASLLATIAGLVLLIPKLAQPRQMIPPVLLAAALLPVAITALAPPSLGTILGAVVATIVALAHALPPSPDGGLAVNSDLLVQYGMVALPVAAATAGFVIAAVPRLDRNATIAVAIVATVCVHADVELRLQTAAEQRLAAWGLFYPELAPAWAIVEEASAEREDGLTIASVTDRPLPLCGPDLRNRVVTIPVRGDGAEHLHEIEQLGAPASAEDQFFFLEVMRRPGRYETWRERLRASGAELLFIHHRERARQGVENPEYLWARARRDEFEVLYESRAVVVYRIRH